jgi:hypothetical protein
MHERIMLWLVGRLPRELRYWCVVAAARSAMSGVHSQENPYELSLPQFLRRITP